MNKYTLPVSISLAMIGNAVQSATPKHPNIVVILADDQGWGDLSFNGNEMVSTPNIDKIAYEGVSFENFYVSPVSSPTRASFLTGRYPFECGVRGVSEGAERLDLGIKTIADYFKGEGYKTGAFGKWHNGTQYPYHPNARGFDEFYGFCSGHWGNYWEPMLDHNGEIITGEGFLPDDLTNKAIDFIKENKNSPFLVYLPLNTPHSPMQMPDDWWNKWDDRPITQFATAKDKENLNFSRAALALTDNIDWNVGRLTNTLEQLGLDDNTIVIYFTDNGPNSARWNGEMKGIKGATHEGGVRSPLFIRWPEKIEAGKVVKQLSNSIDILPTLWTLATTKQLDTEIDGMDLSSSILGVEKSIERSIPIYWGNRLSIRNNEYLLTEDNNLYNVRKDRSQSEKLDTTTQQFKKMKASKDFYTERINTLIGNEDTRPFTIGHRDELYSKLPARDAKAYGGIRRSNQHPNSSYFTKWSSTSDSIVWNVEVCEAGKFEAIVYYTCSERNIGSDVKLSSNHAAIDKQLNVVNDTPMLGADLDRVPRQESYVKGFAPFTLGNIELKKGKTEIVLKANKIANEEVMNMYMLVFKRVD